MKISFFGASVTQQKTGYVYEFKKLNPEYEVYQRGYGGMHICDAGIVFINDIVNLKPDICFIDWFSTGWLTTDYNIILKYIDNILLKLTEINCKVIFLYLPRSPFETKRIKFYELTHKILNEYDVQYIDIYKQFNYLCVEKYNSNNILRDSIHTTDKGSFEYSKIIDCWFKKNINNIRFPNKTIIKNEFYNIKKFSLNKQINIFDKFTIYGNCKEIYFYIRKGPFCGKVKFNENIKNTWDRWCYYERNSFIKVNGFNDNLNIEILDDDFNKDNCKINDFDWDKFKKEFRILDIYYINGKIKI